ncbi:unnamed protein product [Chondrus crispus]|uniref:Pre-mRNA-splicing factor 18 n=1 Tax=Chondrus crispus TaxID=2769 RepID=R7QIS3_CHOCR|nr:unnamed protein product [Chondrus crispus]CDF37653.1 unnamed protein product [Chondrus crispus]|eukprot:XP_005717524.1 unnamed protein product [Chondrus crispus]
MNALAALQAGIAKKRKERSSGPSSESADRPAKRWRSKAEVDEQQRREYYQREKEEAERKRKEKEKAREANSTYAGDGSGQLGSLWERGLVSSAGEKGKPAAKGDQKGTATSRSGDREGNPPLSKGEVVARLRGLKEPVTLFGEDDWDRFDRLREVDLAREEGSKGQRNLFQKRLREMEAKDAEEDMYNYADAKLPELNKKAIKKDKSARPNFESTLGTPNCKEDYVYLEMRKYMGLWASEIESISKEERRTTKGRSLVVTYEETKDWLKPLYRLLRKRKLPKKILDPLKGIFEAAAEREYIRANSIYLEQLAIGKAPWPMGATMVGIHARAAREKIGEDKIAHVMNDDRARKYIQGVKRLLTVAQRHFPTSFSKMIL